MNAVLVALAVLGGVTKAIEPREFLIEIMVCEGDPLGSRAEGNVKILAHPLIATQEGRNATVRTAGNSVVIKGKDGKRFETEIGTDIEVKVVAHPNDQLCLDLYSLSRNLGMQGFTEQHLRMNRLVTLGEKFRVRIAASSPEMQTWAEITVTNVTKAK